MFDKKDIWGIDKDVWDFISRNKPGADRGIDLQVDLCLYYVRDGTTCYSVDQYGAEPGTVPIPWGDFVVTVTLDDTMIYSGSPTQLTQLHHRFQDSLEVQSRVLKISVQGISDYLRPAWPVTQQSGSVALQVHGQVNNIPLHLLMQAFGKYHVDTGEVKMPTELLYKNGYQSLEITTPFYTWLFKNKDQIIHRLILKN